MITQNIQLTLNGDPPFLRLKMRQGDNGRTVVAYIVDPDGQAFDMEGMSAEFRAKKPDGTVIARAEGVSAMENAVAIEITANTLAAAGIINCELVLSHLGTYVGTVTWGIEVWAAVVTESSLISTDDFQSILEAVGRAESYRDEANQYAADASSSEANAAQSEANAAASAAETASYSANPPYPHDNGNWLVWDGTAYVDSGKSWQASGGYMEHSDYDPDDAVKNAGGISTYVSNQIEDLDPDGSVAAAGGIPAYNAANPDERIGQMYDYSSNESAIGHWIDGKTLYRKIIDLGALPNATTKTVTHNVANLDTLITLRGFAYRSSDGMRTSLPFVTNTASGTVDLHYYPTYIQVIAGMNRSTMVGTAIMEYTKTTG